MNKQLGTSSQAAQPMYGESLPTDDRPTFYESREGVNDKIALEEHIESPGFAATGDHPFVRDDYFNDVEHRLKDYELRLEGMDRAGIRSTILSLTQPGIEGITDTATAIPT